MMTNEMLEEMGKVVEAVGRVVFAVDEASKALIDANRALIAFLNASNSSCGCGIDHDDPPVVALGPDGARRLVNDGDGKLVAEGMTDAAEAARSKA